MTINKNFKTSRLFKTVFVMVMSLSTINFSTNVQADDIERLVMSLCEAAKTDDRSSMRKKLKSAKLRLRSLYNGIICGPDGSLLRVATSAGAMDAATFIATKIGKDGLSAAEADGKSIIQWTQDLVSAGDASKQAFVDLYNEKLGGGGDDDDD